MAGIHQTLKEVRELYASLMGSAERAERAVERVEDLEKRVAGLVHQVDETAQIHEKRLRRRTGRWKISWTMSREWCTGLAERGFSPGSHVGRIHGSDGVPPGAGVHRLGGANHLELVGRMSLLSPPLVVD